MKKLFIAIVCIVAAMSAQAQHRGDRYHNDRGYRGHSELNWVVPALITGAIIYGVTREQAPQPPVQQYVPVPQYVPEPPRYVQEGVTCPYGTEATYSRQRAQDQYGRYTEVYQFMGCVAFNR